MSAANKHRIYYTLDGLRAAAAITVVIRHIPHFLDQWSFACCFLTVDLFYLLSGFVLAARYEGEFEQGVSPLSFIKKRFIRLYPLFILGMALGVPVALLSMKFGGLTIDWTMPMFLASIPLSALMLPTPAFTASNVIYPFNPALWCVLFELVANFVFVAGWRVFRKTPLLIAAVLIFAAALAGFSLSYGTLDAGYNWDNVHGGLLRALFGFFTGVLLHRFRPKREINSSTGSVVLTALVLLAFTLPDAPVYSLGVAFVYFPLLILVASMVEPGKKIATLWSVVGTASYALYALHKPIYQLTLGFLKLALPFPPENLAPYIGIAFIPALYAVSILVDRSYNVYLRKRLGY